MERRVLAKQINEISRLTGEFILHSGGVSTTYFDKYKFESFPELLQEIATQASLLIPKDTEVLAGLIMGGIPIATVLSQVSGLPTVFVRKEAKEYGTCRLAEGIDIRDKNVLVIEDVISKGGQVATSTLALRKLGSHIESALCIIDRREGYRGILETVDVKVISLFTSEELSQ